MRAAYGMLGLAFLLVLGVLYVLAGHVYAPATAEPMSGNEQYTS